MTGLEVLVKQGKTYGLFKYRHDGYVAIDYVDQYARPNFSSIKEALDHVNTFFYADGGSKTDDGEVETMFLDGFIFASNKELVPNVTSFDDILEDAEPILIKNQDDINDKGENYCEGLLCPYGDYQLLIDLDKKTVTLNGIEADGITPWEELAEEWEKTQEEMEIV